MNNDFKDSLPNQPPESAWRFVDDLRAPLWTNHRWKSRQSTADEIDFSDGVFIATNFPDSQNLLQTAYDDMREFLRAGNVPLKSTFAEHDKSTFTIETRFAETSIHEEYRIQITREKAIIEAADTEGIRRGLFYLQDEMLRRGGAFLPLGEITRTPVIRTRISRCFFGPINRPPKNRDELADDVNYYPEQYLNRLAHHGINGLWLTVKFQDLCPSRFFPEHGKDVAQRLEKLRKTVQQCARYGIKIYIFCIEPRAFGNIGEYVSDAKTLKEFPQLGGHKAGNLTYFCTSSDAGQEYLESCTRHIFTQVPDLGGLIGINLGERPTHCYSSFNALFHNNCPRCSQRSPGEVFAEMLSAMQRGMESGNPDAELISWLYVPYLTDVELADARRAMAEIAAHIPPKVLLQVNFESNGTARQWGREHRILDYSLAWIGPSEIFADCAAALPDGARLSAKLQVGNSHEVATVPFVPVPENLYHKYRKMRELGVSGAMQCWFFGNYPSVMTQAAGELSFDTIATHSTKKVADKSTFLRDLARTQWGENADLVARAWEYFSAAYSQFPATLQFSWFGPVHDCISWPPHVKPVDAIIQKSWQLADEVSGDRVAECFAYEFSREEIIETCRRISDEWQKGVHLLESIKAQYSPDLQREIGVAQALGLQFRSAYNVMRFYALRDELPFQVQDLQLENLRKMRVIAQEEIANTEKLLPLAREDSRLGFHSEAEGYKYFPEKLEWRIAQIKSTFERDFPEIEQQVKAGKVLFPQFYGFEPQGDVYRARWESAEQISQNIPVSAQSVISTEARNERSGETSPAVQNEKISPLQNLLEANFSGRNDTVRAATLFDEINWKNIPREICRVRKNANNEISLSWKAAADDDNLHLLAEISGAQNGAITAIIEPQRCYPSQKFTVDKTGETRHENRSPLPDNRWKVSIQKTPNGWQAQFTIPWICLREKYFHRRPIRMNIDYRGETGEHISWQKYHPLPARLIFGSDNSTDLGWLIFE